MKKQFGKVVVLMLLVTMFLSACGSEAKQIAEETVAPAETLGETLEPEIELDPEWISETAIDEAYVCLFPLDGEKNVELALEILLPLVEAGNAEAQYYWGYIHNLELVDNKDEEEEESFYWYELAAAQGFAKAYLAAAFNTYVESDERHNELVESAKQAGLFEMSPEVLGADGCFLVGYYYYDKKDYTAALDWFLKSSELGNTSAMADVGVMYYEGTGVKKDIDISLEWLLKAASLGDVFAMDWYAGLLIKDDVISDLLKRETFSTELEIRNTAIKWFYTAAEAGSAAGMNGFGWCYDMGYIGQNKMEQAMGWYTKAADEGHATAMANLGYSYCKKNDYNSAMKWLINAYSNGADYAADDINIMLTSKQGVNAYFENYGELISAKP